MGCECAADLFIEDGNIDKYNPQQNMVDTYDPGITNTLTSGILCDSRKYSNFLAINPLTQDLLYALTQKLQSFGGGFYIKQASEQEMNVALSQNPYAVIILQSVTPHLLNTITENTFFNTAYFNVLPIQITTDFGESQFYTGDYNKFGQCHGKGIWVNCNTKEIYAGGFKNDIFNGKGILILPNGNYYIGDFKDGVGTGIGKLVQKGRIVYEGGMRDFRKFGPGLERYEDGSVFKGDFFNGIKCGYGTMIYGDGTIYEGMFKDSKFDGDGKYTWANGDVYTGQFKNGKFHGVGNVVYKEDGSVFDGTFVNGKKQGLGMMKLKNGDVFNGSWSNNLLHGPGNITNSAGTKNLCFRFGRLVGRD